ncbi:hypothetical protein [Parasphingorhabdus pacifica]
MDETHEIPAEPLPADDTEQTLLDMHDAGEAEPLEFWWRSQHT